MESRKRSFVEEEEETRPKKRSASDANSPSHVNGVASGGGDEPRDGDNLEVSHGIVHSIEQDV